MAINIQQTITPISTAYMNLTDAFWSRTDYVEGDKLLLQLHVEADNLEEAINGIIFQVVSSTEESHLIDVFRYFATNIISIIRSNKDDVFKSFANVCSTMSSRSMYPTVCDDIAEQLENIQVLYSAIPLFDLLNPNEHADRLKPQYDAKFSVQNIIDAINPVSNYNFHESLSIIEPMMILASRMSGEQGRRLFATSNLANMPVFQQLCNIWVQQTCTLDAISTGNTDMEKLMPYINNYLQMTLVLWKESLVMQNCIEWMSLAADAP
jgi:hypothetical protein